MWRGFDAEVSLESVNTQGFSFIGHYCQQTGRSSGDGPDQRSTLVLTLPLCVPVPEVPAVGKGVFLGRHHLVMSKLPGRQRIAGRNL
jgi:hypothetical protein